MMAVGQNQLASIVCSALDKVRYDPSGKKRSPVGLESPGRWPQAAREVDRKQIRIPVTRRKPDVGSPPPRNTQKGIIVFNGHHTKSKGKQIDASIYSSLDDLLPAVGLVVTPPLSNTSLQLYTIKGTPISSISDLHNGSQYVALARGFPFTRLAIPSVNGRRVYPKELDPRHVEEKLDIYEIKLSPKTGPLEIAPNERKQPEVSKQVETPTMTWTEHAKVVLSDEQEAAEPSHSDTAAKTMIVQRIPSSKDILVINGLLWCIQVVEAATWHIRQVLWQKDLPTTVPSNWREMSVKPIVFLTDNCKVVQPMRSVEVLASPPPCVFWVDVKTGSVESASLHTREGTCMKCFKVPRSSRAPSQPSPPRRQQKPVSPSPNSARYIVPVREGMKKVRFCMEHKIKEYIPVEIIASSSDDDDDDDDESEDGK
eukprot:TRINITY_DN9955_c2_g1_i1.p1 TRINITY_DN9955_c2_g1~~TRINITY_DN9955_c2_g1_i1.p1  ORF type:complete len:426 (+),score=79.21 TRINITY_DN9955_c2_g1_i1:144-1421(+)